MSPTRYLVVGAGLAGSATAWRLAERGGEVTLVERTEPAAPDGSSHGSARIFRYAYAQRDYVDLAVRADPAWRELERQHGAPLLQRVGALDHGPGRHPRALAAVLAAAGVEHELLGAAAARRRWPQITFDGEVLHQPGGGVLDAQGTVRAMVALAQRHGARVLTGWELARLERTGAGFTAHARDGRRLDAAHVVVSAGGWLPDLLRELPLPAGFLAAFPRLQVMQENAFHFPYRREHPHGTWPTTIHDPRGWDAYALPGGRDAGWRGHKVALYNAGQPIASAARRTGALDPANRERVTAYVREFLPGLVPEPYAGTACLFTNTPTEDFVVDGADGITVLSACSGHGAKFAPLLGELAADVATGGTAPERFRVGALHAGP
ncbi:FAD-dependent oxidoreductase [Kineococcus indalonis]|uniref:FAD-dependent oxidoreductase n=1 Tax=Kineococcus indalonis TaxID=2696566 RepID=UPI001411BFCC|nr:FAD-dependent oxidoreductase [Kineococcus indalonis]NAZ88582.1 FAD-dependent oxidoreductase [Kineococcus indalonis]